MSTALELAGARLDCTEVTDEAALLHFPHVYVHKSRGKSRGRSGRGHGSGWSQEALFTLRDPVSARDLPSLPGTVADGWAEVGGIRHEMIPLSFKRKVPGRLFLALDGGAKSKP
ncbi:MAG TPA: hypothetical protein VKA13_01125 [Gammaproteobacteria bacterium]|nr:hypothetical protein [Gammaproteobacteria bacterium]